MNLKGYSHRIYSDCKDERVKNIGCLRNKSVYLSVTGQILRWWIFNPHLEFFETWTVSDVHQPTHIVFSDLFLIFPHLGILIIGVRIRALAWDLTVWGRFACAYE